MKNANYSNTWVDFEIIGLGHNWALERTYNSRTLFNGIFGFGWCTNFETSLTITAEGNLKIKECGAGSEIIFYSHQRNRQEIDTVIESIVKKQKNEKGFHQDDGYFKQLREDLLEYDDQRTEMANQFGFLQSPIEGTVYFSETTPQSKIIFHDNEFHVSWSEGQFAACPPGSYFKNYSEYFFEPNGKLKKMQDNNGRVLNLRYFDNGLLSRVSDEKQRAIELEYYPANRKVRQIKSFDHRKSQYQYINTDNLSFSLDSKRYATKYVYDDLHNLTKIIFTDGSRVIIDYDQKNDWVIGFVDRDNCRENYTYDIDPKDSKGHFWSTVKKKCNKKVIVHTRYEFWHILNSLGEYELDRAEEKNLLKENIEKYNYRTSKKH